MEDHASDLAATGDRAEALAVLAARFGPQVAALVEAVTNPVYLPGQDKDEQYRAHVAASLAANPRARVIKVSDFTDNGVGIIHTTGPKAVRLARKYAPLVPVLADLIARPDTPLTRTSRFKSSASYTPLSNASPPSPRRRPPGLQREGHSLMPGSPAVDVPVVTATWLMTD